MRDNVCSGERGLSHDMHVLVSGACPACNGDQPAPAPAMPPAQRQEPRTTAPQEIHSTGSNIWGVTREADGMAHYTLLDGKGWL